MSQKSYTQEELLKIQSLELKALSVLIEICEKLSIDYFLVGGSCLGAVRHNGFIPWDDDIDVGMTREDYLRFLAQAPEHLPKGYTLQTPYNCKQNPYFYTKLRIDGTKFVEYRNRRVKMHHGIYIDIFPYDEVPDDEKRNLREYLRYRRLIQLAVFRQCPGPYKKPDNAVRMCKAIVVRAMYYVLHLIPYRSLMRKLDKLATKNNGANQQTYACLLTSVWKAGSVRKEDLYPLLDHKFEELTVKIPRNWDAYLKTQYGDYWKLPPEDQRVGHRPYEIDFGPYA